MHDYLKVGLHKLVKAQITVRMAVISIDLTSSGILEPHQILGYSKVTSTDKQCQLFSVLIQYFASIEHLL